VRDLPRDDDPVGRRGVLPQRCGAVSPRQEQRKVPIPRVLFFLSFFFGAISARFMLFLFCLFGAQGCRGAAVGGEGWQHEGFRSVCDGLGFG